MFLAPLRPSQTPSTEQPLQLKRAQSDSDLSLASPRAAHLRSLSLGSRRSPSPDLGHLSFRIAQIARNCSLPAQWNLQSAWLHSIWAVKPRNIRDLALQNGGEDPIDAAFQTDIAAQRWLCFLRDAILQSHEAKWIPMENGRGRSQMGLSMLEKREIARLHPSIIPLLIKTPCDKICSKKLIAYICEYLERLNFSAEGWISMKHNLTCSERRSLLSWLLKIKICNLLRDLQDQIDGGLVRLDLEDTFKRHFRSIPDLNWGVYLPSNVKSREERYVKLRNALKCFCRIYRDNRAVRIEQIQPPIEEYICHIYDIP